MVRHTQFDVVVQMLAQFAAFVQCRLGMRMDFKVSTSQAPPPPPPPPPRSITSRLGWIQLIRQSSNTMIIGTSRIGWMRSTLVTNLGEGSDPWRERERREEEGGAAGNARKEWASVTRGGDGVELGGGTEQGAASLSEAAAKRREGTWSNSPKAVVRREQCLDQWRRISGGGRGGKKRRRQPHDIEPPGAMEWKEEKEEVCVVELV
ncbi:hypothetical protein Syun_030760 [Stephania yunnanensis]|uniref:Uncharacterized protein n=1 Tax=Stephania yunnanensis TaxID=152371 RepID=A0AAP0E2T8_9MAGN